jgi:hypothetical protein
LVLGPRLVVVGGVIVVVRVVVASVAVIGRR